MYTPLEIQKISFEKAAFRGYSREDVDDVFEVLSHDYETLYRENLEYKHKIELLEGMVNKYSTMEETMQNALVVAQSAAEDIKKNATQKAEQIVNDAQLQSKALIIKTTEEIASLTVKREQLKSDISAFCAKAVALLGAQINIFNDVNEETKSLLEKE